MGLWLTAGQSQLCAIQTKVFCGGKAFDAEAEQYAQSILSLLKEVGYDAKWRDEQPVDLSGLGIALFVRSPDAQPDHAGPLQRAFIAADIEMRGAASPAFATDAKMVVIIVRQKS